MANYVIEAGRVVSVCVVGADGRKSWKKHTMEKRVTGNVVDRDSGSVVVKVGEFLILRVDKKQRELI